MKNFLAKFYYHLRFIAQHFFELSLTITIGLITLIIITYLFTIFLHFTTAMASYFLSNFDKISPKSLQQYFKFKSDDINIFSSAVSQTAIGALIGTSFSILINFILQSNSQRKKRLTSLRTALIVVESTTKSLLSLKQQFVIPKIYALKNVDETKEINHDIFLKFSESKKIIFNKILAPNYIIELDPKQFFYFLNAENQDVKERIDSMLYYYCKIREGISCLNEAINNHQNLIKKNEKLENTNFIETSQQEYREFLLEIKKSNLEILKLLDITLIFLLELIKEIKNFPKIPKNKSTIKLEFLNLLPKEQFYKEILERFYYKRHKNRLVL